MQCHVSLILLGAFIALHNYFLSTLSKCCYETRNVHVEPPSVYNPTVSSSPIVYVENILGY